MQETDYLKEFDEIFNTKTKKNINLNMPLLKTIFENFSDDIYAPSKEYNRLRNKKIKLSNKLQGFLTEEQREIFNKYNEIENQITSEEELQIFMFGYIVSSELRNEVKQNSILEENT